MIDKCYFKDNKPRKSIPYKGWLANSVDPIENMIEPDDNDILIESILPTMPQEHWKYNLKKNGKFILPKNVRKITWNEAGYYIIYDNNEDDHCFSYSEEYRIADRNGKMLSEVSFQYAKPYPNATIRVTYSHRDNIMDLNGNFLFREPVDCIFGIIYGQIFFVNEGVLYSSTLTGQLTKHKDLRIFDNAGEFYCGHQTHIKDGKTLYGTPIKSCKYFSHGFRGIHAMSDKDTPLDKLDNPENNILIKGQHLLFDNWYNHIINCGGYGIFQVKKGYDLNLINANQDIFIANATWIISNETCIVIKQDGKFYVYDYNGNQISQEFTSCIWRDFYGTWNIHIADETHQKCYLHREANNMLCHAERFLEYHNILALLEQDSIWYWIDSEGNQYECFRNYKHIF